MVKHPYQWPVPVRPALYDELKAKAHQMAAWLESLQNTTVRQTGLLRLDWSLVSKSWTDACYPAVFVTQDLTFSDPNRRRHYLLCSGFTKELSRHEKPSKAYFRWQDNPFNYSTGIDWYLSSHMSVKNWEAIDEEKKAAWHPCGPTFQIAPWTGIENIDHWSQVTEDPEEARFSKDLVIQPPRIPLQWYPLEPHYCGWDEFKDKEFEFHD